MRLPEALGLTIPYSPAPTRSSSEAPDHRAELESARRVSLLLWSLNDLTIWLPWSAMPSRAAQRKRLTQRPSKDHSMSAAAAKWSAVCLAHSTKEACTCWSSSFRAARSRSMPASRFHSWVVWAVRLGRSCRRL